MKIFKVTRTEYTNQEGYFPPDTKVFKNQSEAEAYFKLQIENNLNALLPLGASIKEVEEWQEELFQQGEVAFRYFFDEEQLITTKAICRCCGGRLKPSAAEDYKYFCPECDEDFYSFEAIEAPHKENRKIIAAMGSLNFVEQSIWVETPDELKKLLWENVETSKMDLDDSYEFASKAEISVFVDECGDIEKYLSLYCSKDGQEEFGVTIKYL